MSVFCSGEIASEIDQLISLIDARLQPRRPIADEFPDFALWDDAKQIEFYQKEMQVAQQKMQEIQDAKSRLAARGDEAVKPIMQKFRAIRAADRPSSSEFLECALDILAQINTPKSQQALLSTGLPGAVRRYVKNLEDTSKASELLENERFQNDVLIGLQGSEIGEGLYEAVEGFLYSDQPHLREGAAKVFALDPNTQTVEKRVNSLIQSLLTVEQMPDSDMKYQSNMTGTRAMVTYHSYIESLLQLNGLDRSILPSYAEQLNGMPLLCVQIALADRGDISVKESLKTAARNINIDYRIRRLILTTLERLAVEDDIAYFEWLAENDPLKVAIAGQCVIEMVDEELLVKWDKEDEEGIWFLLEVEAKQLPQRVREMYPIRDDCREILSRLRQR